MTEPIFDTSLGKQKKPKKTKDSKVIRETLKELVAKARLGSDREADFYMLNQAETELLAYFRGIVPEKKEMPKVESAWGYQEVAVEHWNRCVDLTLKNLGAEGEGR